MDQSKLQQEARSTLPPLFAWERWDELPRQGQFYCEDLAKVRQWFLCSGRTPRVSLKSVVEISSLTYVCTQRKDGADGTCKIRQLPAEAESIQRWLAKLPLGDDFEYRGEGLPAVTQRCLLRIAEGRATQPCADREAAHPRRARPSLRSLRGHLRW